MIQALQATEFQDVSLDTVAITAPYFGDDDQAGTGYPFNPNGATPDERYPSAALVWWDDHWAGGATNQYPPSRKFVSSFDVLDQLVQYYGNKAMFPNIHQIVVAGHSMGAQMVHRYAAVGKTSAQLGITTPVSYWIGDPNSYVWFATDRPLSTSKCAADIYDNWREGFTRYVPYGSAHSTNMMYNTALVAQGRDALLANYQSRTIAHARAIQDHGDYSDDCAPYTTGQDRNERFFTFIKRFPISCANPAGPGCHTVDIVNSPHDAPTMFKAAAGQTRLFKDNWNGLGGRHYDFGYPRHASYDDPYPDPYWTGQNGGALINYDPGVYAGNKISRGCWTDVDPAQSIGALPVLAYTGDQNSRSFCANLCTTQGYPIAGVSWNNCYCGNAMGAQSTDVVITSCEGPCPGVAGTFCGGPNRLSILSSIALH